MISQLLGVVDWEGEDPNDIILASRPLWVWLMVLLFNLGPWREHRRTGISEWLARLAGHKITIHKAVRQPHITYDKGNKYLTLVLLTFRRHIWNLILIRQNFVNYLNWITEKQQKMIMVKKERTERPTEEPFNETIFRVSAFFGMDSILRLKSREGEEKRGSLD